MPPALVCLKASTRMAVWDWLMARSEIWIQDECQVNILLLPAATIIHSPIAARKETWKPFPSLFSVLISRSLARIVSITIAHLFSFVSPLVSPFNPFSFPPQFPLQLLSFQPHLSISPLPLSDTPLSPFTSSLTSSVSLPPPVCHLSPFSFNLPFFILHSDCSLSQTFSSSIGIFCLLLSFFLNTHWLALCRMPSPLSLHSRQSPPRTN